MFSWQDTRWYWLMRYSDLKSDSKPVWYLRSSHHLRSQSQFKHLLLENFCFWRENRWEADFQSRPGQPHDLYHKPQLRSRLQQIWVEVSQVVFFASSFNKQLRSSTHPHSLPKTFAETKKWKRANAAASCHQTILYLDFQTYVSAPAIKLKKHDCNSLK